MTTIGKLTHLRLTDAHTEKSHRTAHEVCVINQNDFKYIFA